MKTIIRIVLLITAAVITAVVFRVVNTLIFTGIDQERVTIYGESRCIEMSGDVAGIVISDMLSREPDLMVDSEERIYENGDILSWKLTDDGNREFRYRVADTARFLSGLTFSWTVTGVGVCPLESL